MFLCLFISIVVLFLVSCLAWDEYLNFFIFRSRTKTNENLTILLQVEATISCDDGILSLFVDWRIMLVNVDFYLARLMWLNEWRKRCTFSLSHEKIKTLKITNDDYEYLLLWGEWRKKLIFLLILFRSKRKMQSFAKFADSTGLKFYFFHIFRSREKTRNMYKCCDFRLWAKILFSQFFIRTRKVRNTSIEKNVISGLKISFFHIFLPHRNIHFERWRRQ